MPDFKALLQEGLFYERAGSFFIEQADGTHTDVRALLTPLEGLRVQFALHYLPPNGIQAGEPGAGSCRYPQGRGCPIHGAQWDRMLSFHLEGVLGSSPWRITKFDGLAVRVPFEAMPGHFGRLAVATVLDIESMRDALSRQGPGAQVQGVGAGDLQQILERLRKQMEP